MIDFIPFIVDAIIIFTFILVYLRLNRRIAKTSRFHIGQNNHWFSDISVDVNDFSYEMIEMLSTGDGANLLGVRLVNGYGPYIPPQDTTVSRFKSGLVEWAEFSGEAQKGLLGYLIMTGWISGSAGISQVRCYYR